MSSAAVTVFTCIITIECFVISAGNIFTIFVFWKNRKLLKRTSSLLINLAVADLLVGLSTLISVVEFRFNSQQFTEHSTSNTVQKEMISNVFQSTFSSASVFFLVLISLERAYALIWPLRHRAASTKGYIYSVLFVWIVGISVGGMSLLATYNIINSAHWMVALCAMVIFALALICLSYFAIRTKLNCRVPAIGTAHNNDNVHNQSKKLSKTLFVVIAASLVFWFPSTVVYCIYYLCSICVPVTLLPISTMLHATNSLVNPIIYSLRIPMFKETMKRMKLKKKSKQYKVNYSLWFFSYLLRKL